MPVPSIKIVPTTYQEVMSLLKSNALRAVEEAIATQVGQRIIRDYGTAETQHTQAIMSVSGMHAAEIENYLADHRDRLIAFGVRFLRDKEATKTEEEYPPGEEQDEASGESVSLGLGSGFGITYAIYHSFLANRPVAEFRQFLQNRRIPHHSKFAKELRRVFEETSPTAKKPD
jgi:hypothetical protein